jgi:CubicO group peptidase (beta-lactamase class C family)
MNRRVALCAALALAAGTMPARAEPAPHSALDAEIEALMRESGARGMAVAVTEGGEVRHVRAFGQRNEAGDPLTEDTIMYGASLTKAVFGYLVAQLAAEGRIDLDTSIAEYLPRPLPEYADAEDKYGPWHHLAGDERWRKLTPRILLNHASGFHNFSWLEPDRTLRIHFDPGERYSYSGDGVMLLQFVLEQGLGLDVEKEFEARVFGPFGMDRSSLIWRDEFRTNLADGWTEDGEVEPHDERSRVRAAGSLDTTIADMARFSAGVMGGPEGLREDLARPQLPIRTLSQFPLLRPDAPPHLQVAGLSAGLGVVTFEGPQGRGFYKGGHNDSTGNTWVCLIDTRKCVILLGNDVRAERTFPKIVRLVLGDTGAPWRWEYGDWAAE